MAKITEYSYEATGRPAVICDFSPPRSGSTADLLQPPEADFLLVAYNPGRAVRANSAMLAACLQRQTGRKAAFALATRDMNRLALQSQLLGAQLLGLENVVVVQGDPFSPADGERVKNVSDYRPTELIAAIATLNLGRDFRGGKLTAPTDFCIGATADLGRGFRREARLAYRKVKAGAHFLITQPIFDPQDAARFREACAEVAGEPLPVPVFYGLQVLEPGGVAFGPAPESVRAELDAGRSPVEFAAELYARLRAGGVSNIYLIPGIRRGGARNYAAAQEVLDAIRE